VSTSGSTTVAATTNAAKPDASVVHPTNSLPVGALLQNAAEVHTVTDKPDARHSAGKAPAKDDKAEAKRAILLPAPASATSEPPPPVELAATAPPADLARSATEAATMPQLGVRVSQGIIEAKLIHKVEPVYPQQARARGLTGSVILDATIAEDGSVRALKIIDGPSLLSASATAAVRQWKYSPAILNGNAIEAQKRITINFKLP
jgi:protein TonB